MADRVYLSIGSNIGDRLANLKQAVNLLSANAAVQIKAISSVYETEPWGNLNQASFYNIAVAVTTSLRPQALLDLLHEIEQAGHRERKEHWGPRTIDLDIIYWGDQHIHTETLEVPHPRAAERNFVLLPIEEIATDDPKVAHQVQTALAAEKDKSWINIVEGATVNNDGRS